MNDLDTRIRNGLADAAGAVEPVSTAELAAALGDRGPRRSRTTLPRPVLAAAAVVAVVAVVAGIAVVAIRGDDDPGSTRVLTSPPSDGPGATWSPGWQELDTGPVPAASGADVVWADGELLVLTPGALHRWNPTDGWSAAASPPIDRATAVWAGDRLVVVEYGASGDAASAWWEPGADEWHSLPALPDRLPGALGAAPTRPTGLNLVWTGKRVLDLTHGAVLDPANGAWTRLATLTDMPIQHQLGGFQTAVWDGREVILAPFSTEPGAAWNATGTEVRRLPGIPADLVVNPAVREDAVASELDGRVVYVSGTDAGRALAFDGRTDTWSRLPDVPRMISGEGCPSNVASAAGTVVFQPCGGGPPVRLEGDRWVDLQDPPFGTECCLTAWIDVDGALLVWGTDDDIQNNPNAPYVRAAVWSPETAPSSTDTADPGANTSTTLPAIGTTRGNAVTAWTGTEYLVWGGQAGGDGYGRADGWVYDPETGGDRPIPVAPMPPLDEAFGAWNGRELVVVGGLVPGSWERTGRAAGYDPSLDRWRQLPDLPDNAGVVVGAAGVGDDVYVITDGPRLFELAPAGDRWLPRSAPSRVDGPTWPLDQVVAGADELLLWHPGDRGDAPGELYDPASDTWTTLPPVPAVDRMEYGSAEVAGRWIVAWGLSATDETRTSGARLDLEDPEAGWQPVSDAPLGPIEWYEGTPGSQTLSADPATSLLWVTPVTGDESYDPDRTTIVTGLLTYDPTTDRWARVPDVEIFGYAPDLTIGRTSSATVVLRPDVEEPARFVPLR